jgi:hypothetical protein
VPVIMKALPKHEAARFEVGPAYSWSQPCRAPVCLLQQPEQVTLSLQGHIGYNKECSAACARHLSNCVLCPASSSPLWVPMQKMYTRTMAMIDAMTPALDPEYTAHHVASALTVGGGHCTGCCQHIVKAAVM